MILNADTIVYNCRFVGLMTPASTTWTTGGSDLLLLLLHGVMGLDWGAVLVLVLHDVLLMLHHLLYMARPLTLMFGSPSL